MKKAIAFIVGIVIVISTNMTVFALPTFTPEVEVKSEAAILINTDTDTIVYEKNTQQTLPPASLVKIMTAILALEKVEDLDVVVEASMTVFNDIYGKNASNADIRPNEQVRMIDLLYALLLQSACEAAGIIAEYVGGDQATFVQMMNQKAAEIGAVNTVFTDAHGLDDQNQYTTAYDMYLITKYALTLPLFENIATTTIYEMPATNKHSSPRNVYHTNYMLSNNLGGSYYNSAVRGIKTGTTGNGTKNLVSLASSNGYNYMLVVLGAPIYKDENGNTVQNTYIDSTNIYKWAFEKLDTIKVIDTSFLATEVEVKFASRNKNFVILVPENSVSALLPKTLDLETVEKNITVSENVEAPVRKGDVLGSMELLLDGETIGTVNLVASNDVERSMVQYILSQTMTLLSNDYVKIAGLALALVIIIYIIYAIIHNKRKRKSSIFYGKTYKRAKKRR